MKYGFMGAFRYHGRDQDRLERYLRLLRCLYLAIVGGAIWSLALSFFDLVHKPMPFSILLTSVLAYSIAMFLFHGSYDGGALTSPLRRPYLVPCAMALLIAAAETTPAGWWNQPVVLERLRYGLLAVASVWVLLWVGERAVRRSRR